MRISIASGKGGTGKTCLVASFAALAEKKVFCDADVDAGDSVRAIWKNLSYKLDLNT